MNFLLDTHIFLWWLGFPEKLTQQEIEILSSAKNLIYVSAVSIWEITLKKSLGKLIAPNNIHETIEQNDFLPLSISVEHAHAILNLPNHHEDPFDRMLIAQSMTENLKLISRDKKIQSYSSSSFEKCPTAFLF